MWEMSNSDKKYSGLYFHVGNSGLTVDVIDEGFGPTLSVSTGAFGNLQLELKTYLEPECLQQLSDYFGEAAKKTYSKTYGHAAKKDPYGVTQTP
jgi:hypothetical protein